MNTLLRHLTAAALIACAPNLQAADTIEFTADSYQMYEGPQFPPVQLIRTGASFPATVRVVVEGGTAKDGEDFTLERREFETSFPGNGRPEFLTAIDDGIPEGDETIVLRLVDPTNGLQLGPRTQTTITLHNSPTSYSFSSEGGPLIGAASTDTLDVPEGPSAVCVLRRSGDRDRASVVELKFRVLDDIDNFPPSEGVSEPAKPDVDFFPGKARIEFAPGENEKIVSLPIPDNGVVNVLYRFFALEIEGIGLWAVVIVDNERATHLDVTYAPRSLPLNHFTRDFTSDAEDLSIPLAGGRTVIRGKFSAVNGRPLPGLARLLPDGTVDDAFRPSSSLATNPFRLLGVHPPGSESLLLQMTGESGRLLRLRADGSEDPDFKPQLPITEPELFGGPWSAIAPDGSIWAVRGARRYRLSADGSVLLSNPIQGPGPNLWQFIRFVGLQPTAGQLIVQGDHSLYRLALDGSIDTGFRPIPSGAPNWILPDGRIAPFRQGMRVYFPDGELDSTLPPLLPLGPTNPKPNNDNLVSRQPPYLEGYTDSVNLVRVGRFTTRVRLGGLPQTSLQLVDYSREAMYGPFERFEPKADSAEAFRVHFRRLGPSSGPATVHFTTRDRSVTAGKDYLAQSGTLIFAPLEVEKEILIPVLADAEAEADETLEVVVTGATGIEELPAPMLLTILGDLGRPLQRRLDRIRRLGNGIVLLGSTGDLTVTRDAGGGRSFSGVEFEHSTDLHTWHPLRGLVQGTGLDGLPVWLDASATNAPTRYYRAVAP